jgi:hypothetical protein
LSLPIQYLYENSARENIRLKAAIYPTIKKDELNKNTSDEGFMINEGMSNMMKEGFKKTNTLKQEKIMTDKCKCSPSNYPGIYRE